MQFRRLTHPWLFAELPVAAIALLLRLSFILRLDHSILSGALNGDELIYWRWSEHILRAGVVGPNAFFMGPLYPYTLAAIRSILPAASVATILYSQAVLGTSACVLLTNTCRRVMPAASALVVGLLAAGYTRAILHDGLILMESLVFFLGTLLFCVVVRTSRAPTLGRFCMIGATVGLMTQARGTSAVLLPAALIGLRSVLRTVPRVTAYRYSAGALSGFLCLLLPSTLHNWIAVHDFIPLTYNHGFNLYVGNNAAATGSFVVTTSTYNTGGDTDSSCQGGAVADGRSYVSAALGHGVGAVESSSYWLGQALNFMREEPSHTLRLTLQKASMLWNRREYPQIESLELFQQVLGYIGLVEFWLVVSLALPSLIIARGREPWQAFLTTALIGLSVVTIPFFVVDRYRLQLVPFVLPFAGMTMTWAGNAWRSKREALKLASLVLVTGCVLNLPAPERDPWQVRWASAADLADRWMQRGRPDVAWHYYERADGIERQGLVRGTTSVTARLSRAAVYESGSAALVALGDTSRAIAWLGKALSLVPGAPSLRERLGVLYAMRGDGESARRLAGADTTRQQWSRHWFILSTGLLDEGDRRRAGAYLQASIAIDSTNTLSWAALIRLAVEGNEQQRATALLERAERLGVDGAALLAQRVALAAAQGDTEAADRYVRGGRIE